MMASGEIRLSTTTMRQMPVLAQSPPAQSQAPQSQTSNDGLQEITVTADRGPSDATTPLADPTTPSVAMGPVDPQQIEDDLAGQQEALDNATKARSQGNYNEYNYYMNRADYWMRQYFNHMGTPLNGSDYGQNPEP